jgi:hypothetical protein
LIILLVVLTVLLREKMVEYSVKRYLTEDEQRLLDACSEMNDRGRNIIYWPSRVDDKPSRVRHMEYNRRRIKYLKSVAVTRCIKKFIFS